MAAPFEPDPFKFGYHYDMEADKADKNTILSYPGERHILLFGVNGAGKSTRILVENLVTLKNRSFVVIDVKGELTAQTQRTRRTFGDVKIIDPFGVLKKPLPDGCGLDLESDGYNPLALLDPDDDEFFDNAKLLTLAIIELEGETQKFFPESAQGWFCVGIMMEVITAQREGRPPSLLQARRWCLQPNEWEEVPPIKKGKTLVPQPKVQTAGVWINAKKAMAEGGQLADLAAGFADEEGNQKEMKSVLSTLRTQTEFLVSKPIARDVEKGEWSFAQLKERPTTVYIVLPPKQLSDKRRWVRMLISDALNGHLHPGPCKTLFILDEFRVTIGYLPIVNDFWSLVRGYGVQFMPVCQSITQLQHLFKEEWPNYAGQSGAVATIGPPGDEVTAAWMSARGGNKTIWQEGLNTGDSQNTQGGQNTSTGESRSKAARAVLLPQEIMSMKIGTGIIWLSGEGELLFPYYAPEYKDRPDILPLIDPNPYHANSDWFSGNSKGLSAEAQTTAQRAAFALPRLSLPRFSLPRGVVKKFAALAVAGVVLWLAWFAWPTALAANLSWSIIGWAFRGDFSGLQRITEYQIDEYQLQWITLPGGWLSWLDPLNRDPHCTKLNETLTGCWMQAREDTHFQVCGSLKNRDALRDCVGAAMMPPSLRSKVDYLIRRGTAVKVIYRTGRLEIERLALVVRNGDVGLMERADLEAQSTLQEPRRASAYASPAEAPPNYGPGEKRDMDRLIEKTR